MKKLGKLVLISLLVLLVASCTTFKADGLAYGKSGDVTILGEFEKTITVWKFLGTSGGATLFNVSQAESEDKITSAIQKEILNYGGDAAIGVTIEQKASFVDMLINGFTGDILAPVKVIITGKVVKYNSSSVAAPATTSPVIINNN